MSERPILFSGEMVRAILEGRKSQTRRVVKDVIPWATEWFSDASGGGLWMPNGPSTTGRGCAGGHWRPCPYGIPGNRLWVREAFNLLADEVNGVRFNPQNYRATRTMGEPPSGWRPSIHMPRFVSRITLEITKVRVERVQDISHKDALAEGCRGERWVESSPYIAGPHTDDGILPREEYRILWNHINEKRGFGWDKNPWVWVIEFKRAEP